MLRGLLDPYERKARLTPALLVALPIAILCFAAGWTTDRELVGAAAALVVEFGLPVAMANFTRIAGKGLETDLWQSWGGPPTTARLRYANNNEDLVTALRAQLQKLVPEISLPTHESESTDPTGTDRRLEAIVEVARSRLRDRPTSRLLFNENCSYGFHRNMLGLRPAGKTVAIACLAASVAILVGQSIAGTFSWPILLAGVAAATAIGLWHRIGPRTVQRAADSYAEAFVGAVLATAPSRDSTF